MNIELISSLSGSLLSLLFSYVPGLATNYSKFSPIEKRLVMLLTIFVVTTVIVLYNCIDNMTVVCDNKTLIEWGKVFFYVLLSNQSVDRISPTIGEKK